MTDARDTRVPDEHHVHRTGDWLSQDKRHHHKFLKDTIEHVDKNPKSIHPAIEKFGREVKNDSRLYMLFSNMFSEIPHSKPYLHDPTNQYNTVRDFDHLLALINHVLSTAPRWTDAGHSVGLVGVPVNAILDWPMATRAGFTAFQDPKVNQVLKEVLDAWGQYLSSPESAEVLGTDNESWFSPHGIKALEDVANAASGTSYTFDQLFHCDTSDKHHGYKSWDDFFTRQFRWDDGIRPVAGAEDDSVVVNACESKMYKVGHDVKEREKFWIKGQPYSVKDMLAFDDLHDQFIGGTIYQAFLSALSYHRWHCPVAGVVKKAYVVPGTYYSEPLYENFTSEEERKGTNGETTSQEYLSAVATRAIMFIESDNPKIGMIAVLGIGMTEVSTCEITVKEGQHVKKGDELGMFHFGGSTHCVLFRKGVKVTGFPQGSDHNVPVRSKLCHVE